MSKHYVARIVVEKVEKPEPSKVHGYDKPEPRERVVTELGTVTIKDGLLESLVDRISEAAHFIKDYE
jgi:hypothetical protein